MLGDIESLLLGPLPYRPAVLAICCRPGDSSPTPRPDRTGVVDEHRQLLAESLSMLRVQVNFEFPAIQTERDRLVSRATRQIIFELHFQLLHVCPLVPLALQCSVPGSASSLSPAVVLPRCSDGRSRRVVASRADG